LDDRSDENLVVASRAGDRSAYAVLVQRHYRQVFLLCLGVLGNVHDAEDLAQDAMLKGFEQITKLRDGSQFGRWVATIGKNMCINLARRRKRAKNATEKSTGQKMQSVTANDNLLQAIEQLSGEIRLPLVMYYFDGQSVKTVSKRLNMSTSGVYLKLRTAIKQLHEILTEQGDKE